jgi:transposase
VLAKTQDNEQIIERVAALDIGKAELVCCVRVPDEDHRGRRLQEVETYSTMTRALLSMAGWRHCYPPRFSEDHSGPAG